MSLQYDSNGKLIDGTQQMQYNGSTYDVVQNNTQGTLLASAARTGTLQSPLQTNYNAKGVQLILNVTVVGTGNITLQINSFDPISGAGYQVAPLSALITGGGVYVVELYPGDAAATLTGASAVSQKTSGVLPRTWAGVVNKSDVSSWTFSLGYQLIL